MKRRLVTILGVVLLSACTKAGGISYATTPNDPKDILVGAIKWDGWYKVENTTNSVPSIVEENLSFEKFNFRIPFFAKLEGGKVVMPYATQELIDQEIKLAADAGIDYWAYCWYRNDGSGLGAARRLHCSSQLRNSVKMCAMLENGHFNTDQDIAAILNDFRQEYYQKVDGGRPLVYFFDNNEQTPQTVIKLREAARKAAIPDPYIVMMGHTDPCSGAEAVKANGVSRYVTLGTNEEPYSQLMQRERKSWAQFKKRGHQVIPIVTAGWDPKPRIGREPWGKYYCSTCWTQTATAQQIADQITAGIKWVKDNADSCPALSILIYAWNEYDEGGWIAPVLSDYKDNKLIPERLNVISKAINEYRK